jgi:replicative DNA helicase
MNEEKPKEHRPSDMPSITAELYAWWDGIRLGEIKFIKGLPLLEEYLPAFIPGHVIFVSGYTSAGKSLLLAQITTWVAGENNSDTLVISVEDSRQEKTMTMISVLSEVHRKVMLLGEIKDKEFEINNALGIMQSWPLRIYDDAYTLDEIESLILQHKPKVVIIDYVQNLSIPRDSLYSQMSYAAQRIFKMAQDYYITMIVASQVSNVGAKEENPAIIDLKGAGELAAVAHTVLQLVKGREEKNYHVVDISITKNKAFGKCGKIKCEFNSSWTKIQRSEDKWNL